MRYGRYATTTVLSAALPVRIGTTGSASWRILGQVPIPCVQALDVISWTGSYQVSSEYSYNSMVSRTAILADVATALPDQSPGSAGTVSTLARPMAQNFNGKAEHHFMDSLGGTWVAPAMFVATPLWLSVCAYAAGSPTYAKTGDELQVDRVDVQVLLVRDAQPLT